MKTNLFNAMFQQSAIAMSIINVDGSFLYVNDSLCKFTGYKKEELINKTNAVFTHPDDIAFNKRYIDKLINGELSFFQMEKRYIHKSGKTIWGLISVNLICDDYGIPKYIICQVQNITEKKEMEQLLLESEDRYRRLVEFSPETIVVLVEEEIAYINPAGLKLINATKKEDVIGRIIWEFLAKEHYSDAKENFSLLLNGSINSLVSREYTIINVEGYPITVTSTMNVSTYNGKLAIQAIVRDITETKKLDDWLQKSEKLSLVGQLAAGVAHEVRNPLTSIKGFIQLVKTTKELKEFYIDIILSELDRTESIIYEFLSLAKPNGDRVLKKVNFNIVLKKVINLLETQALMRNIHIKPSFTKELEIVCDENQMKQVFMNLIQNAIEASNTEGTIFILLNELDEGHIIVKIEDQGCGIPKERLKKLGEPFYSTKEKGTGLGLLVTYKIIESHNGKLNFSSEEGIGTTAEVILPKIPELSLE